MEIVITFIICHCSCLLINLEIMDRCDIDIVDPISYILVFLPGPMSIILWTVLIIYIYEYIKKFSIIKFTIVK